VELSSTTSKCCTSFFCFDPHFLTLASFGSVFFISCHLLLFIQWLLCYNIPYQFRLFTIYSYCYVPLLCYVFFR
jgi:hypothetical protein